MKGMETTCQQCLAWLSDHLDGELNAAYCAQFRSHLDECPRCRALLQNLQTTQALLADDRYLAPPAEASARLRQALENGLDEPLLVDLRPAAPQPVVGRQRPWWQSQWAGAWAAAIVLLVLAVGVVRWRAGAVTTSGWLIDRHCLATFASHPADHPRDCLLRCAKLTYGVVDAKGHFTPFDAQGSKRALAAVEASNKPDHLWVTVTGKKSASSPVLEVQQIELTDPSVAASRY
jgi:hypothetical protein